MKQYFIPFAMVAAIGCANNLENKPIEREYSNTPNKPVMQSYFTDWGYVQEQCFGNETFNFSSDGGGQVLAADMDGDGDLDLVMHSTWYDRIFICENRIPQKKSE